MFQIDLQAIKHYRKRSNQDKKQREESPGKSTKSEVGVGGGGDLPAGGELAFWSKTSGVGGRG